MADEGEAGCEYEFPAHYKVMLDKLNEQRQLGQFTDITLIVDGHQFRAHKAVLAACSQFFHKFFQDYKLDPLVEIEGVSNSAFRYLLEFTYTATLLVNTAEEVSDVWKAAQYLQMQEAIKALKNRTNGSTTLVSTQVLGGKSKAKKRKIAETSNVITETLPSVEAETLIEVEVAEMEEEVDAAVVAAARNAQASSDDDSALALLADITSKYRPGDTSAQGEEGEEKYAVAAVVDEEELVLQEETVMAPKALEGIEVVEVQISQLDNMFRCDKCERCFKNFYHLKQHMKSHESEVDSGDGGVGGGTKHFVCRHCGKFYVREGALKQHLNSYHYEAESRRQRPQKKVHVCEYCDKQFDHFGHFKEHLRKHTGEKPFECPDCHERFARNSTLKCHMAACQNGCGAKKGRKKLYECQVCNSVFNSWDQFKDHLVIHTGEKPNHCTFCDLWFMQPRDLRSHLADQHGMQDDSIAAAVPSPGDNATAPPTAEEVLLAEASSTSAVLAAVATASGGGDVGANGARLLLTTEDGIRVEHVTVESMDMVAMEETLVVHEVVDEEAVVAAAVAAAAEASRPGVEFKTMTLKQEEAQGSGAAEGQEGGGGERLEVKQGETGEGGAKHEEQVTAEVLQVEMVAVDEAAVHTVPV